MRFAIIDIGTNTFKLLILEQINNTANIIFKNKLPVKLGEGGLSQNIIAPRAYTRGINALIEHQKVITEYGCDKIFTFATSGLRSTNNGSDFIQDVKEKIGIEINVIDGNQEAQYIYDGVRKALKIPSNSCIIDIGGGSTEFVICNYEEVFWKRSYKLGVSRLYEMFSPNDPLRDSDIKEVEAYLAKELSELFDELKKNNVEHMIGSSGSFKSFSKIISTRNNLPSEAYYREISHSDLLKLHKDFIKMNVFQRLSINGMEAMRADMIPMASVMVNYILNQHNFKQIHISGYSLKEGVIEEILSSLD